MQAKLHFETVLPLWLALLSLSTSKISPGFGAGKEGRETAGVKENITVGSWQS